jgi:nucleotide-binding universal stress UspA family protein
MTTHVAYRTIIVGVDHSSLAGIARDGAAKLAARVRAERLHLVRVVEPFMSEVPAMPFVATGAPYHELWEATLKEAERELTGLSQIPLEARITHAVRVGAPAKELACEALHVKADLIVVASHERHGLRRIIVGSVASALLRAAHCPVLVIGKDRPVDEPFRRVVAGVDLSWVCSKVLAHAIANAALHQGSVHVVSALENLSVPPNLPPQVAEELAVLVPERYRAQLAEIAECVRDPTVELTLETTSNRTAKDAIFDSARRLNADLIVIGTSGHNAWQRMYLGSTATHVTSEAPCPVLIIPHDAPPVVAETADVSCK